jgi:hypothetical protein
LMDRWGKRCGQSGVVSQGRARQPVSESERGRIARSGKLMAGCLRGSTESHITSKLHTAWNLPLLR